ncbi:MAG: 30S ribosomal protein S2 [Candidatus Nezhaarchaeales archaeon]
MSEAERQSVTSSKAELLAPLEVYLAAGLHIGTHIKSGHLKPFIYRVRSDGLCIIDVAKIDERVRIASKFISRYEPSKVVVASSKQYGKTSVEKFCALTGAKPVVGRFIPGTFTNPRLPTYIEPELVVITDPRADEQALIEASKIGIPIVALCDTDNDASYVDLIIPVNNKGRKALAFTYWLLAKQILKERGLLAPDAEFSVPIEEFETKVVEAAHEEE